MSATRVACPTCGRETEWNEAQRWRPFCSERCRLVDLGAWLTEQHAIPGESQDEAGSSKDADDLAHRDPNAPRP